MVFRADDKDDLRAKLTSALTADLPSFQSRVAGRIAGYSYDAASAGLQAALDSLPPSRP